jgi:hypothetical protein
MLGLLPGQKGFGPWFRNMIANASVFVVVPIMFVLQHAISGDITSWVFGINASGVGANLSLPFLGTNGIQTWILNWIVGFIILTMTPKVADMVKEALKVPPFKHGTGLTELAGFYRGAYGLFDYKGSEGRTRNELADALNLGEIRNRMRRRNQNEPEPRSVRE